MSCHGLCNLRGLFWLFVSLIFVETCLFSAFFIWTLPRISSSLNPRTFVQPALQPGPEQHHQTLAESVTRSGIMHRTIAATLAVILAGILGQGTAQAPIPPRPPGFIYNSGASDAPIQLEAWLDLVCPDSKEAWPTYKKVADYYGPSTLRFSALMFPLPYHRAAMFGAQGAFVADILDANTTVSWMDIVFEKQATLYDTTIAEKPNSYIVDTYSEWASQAGYSKSKFKERLARSDPTQSLARVEFKYGATRGVYETPQTFINGAVVFADPSWSLSDWRNVIDPLLAKNKYFYRHH